MSDKKISELAELELGEGTTLTDTDLVPVVDVSDDTDSNDGTTKKTTFLNLAYYVYQFLTDPETLRFNFLSLNDTPDGYTEQAGMIVAVKEDETGLEFKSGSTVTSDEGAPATTPTALGQIYIDTDSQTIYISAGMSSSDDWVQINNLE